MRGTLRQRDSRTGIGPPFAPKSHRVGYFWYICVAIGYYWYSGVAGAIISYWFSFTIAGRCVLKVRTVWKTSTTPSYCILSNTIDKEMKTPVRPTPALQDKIVTIWMVGHSI